MLVRWQVKKMATNKSSRSKQTTELCRNAGEKPVPEDFSLTKISLNVLKKTFSGIQEG